MQVVERSEASSVSCGTNGVAVWGLSARELHDAYWRARGVDCVRRGTIRPTQRAAELYLLMEPGQLVLFDLAKLIDRLIWRKAAVTRLRIVDEDSEPYRERVVIDEHGLVTKIERVYRRRARCAYRIMLTASRTIAELWAAASSRRAGWDQVRRSVAWSKLDHWRCSGRCFTEGSAKEEGSLISELAATWPDPARVVDGIEQIADGVWAIAGAELARDADVIGPIWLGIGDAVEPGACVVGPAWMADQQSSVGWERAKPGVRDIRDVDLGHIPKDLQELPEPNFGSGAAKRIFDIVVSAVVILLAAPLFATAAVCILLEDGRPVFFGHVRQSRGGRLFRCWKFRTMSREAQRIGTELADLNLCDGPQVLIKNDPRITRVGAILRRFQIDEFPQFFNVLRGQMSIVGPRPSPDQENQYCPAWRDLRLSVRPGITGLWQVRRTRAPGEDFQEWIRYDMEYVRRASFWFDLKLCFKTAWVLLLGSRA